MVLGIYVFIQNCYHVFVVMLQVKLYENAAIAGTGTPHRFVRSG